jgi:chromate transport protein ChrA
MFYDLSWTVVFALGATGILMALLSSLVGMRQKVENPAWWGLYALWVAFVFVFEVPSPFTTILLASILAGLLHGSTQSLLLDHYIANNPWYAEQMQGPRKKLRLQFLLMGLGIGAGFGVIVGGIAWGIDRFLR